jgi:hypothetical protein
MGECAVLGITSNTFLHMPRVALALKCAREDMCLSACSVSVHIHVTLCLLFDKFTLSLCSISVDIHVTF